MAKTVTAQLKERFPEIFNVPRTGPLASLPSTLEMLQASELFEPASYPAEGLSDEDYQVELSLNLAILARNATQSLLTFNMFLSEEVAPVECAGCLVF